MKQIKVDVAVVGGGPAGLAAAIAADRAGASVLLCERETRLGGILKQCIHDGFGLVRFGEKLSGPEYAGRFVDELAQTGVQAMTLAFVTGAVASGAGYALRVVTREGLCAVEAGALVLATGCRERTARQVSIHGTRPSGVLTAGTAQHYVNLLGELPARRCVILGSGDIGLIMARRLTLEGAQVLGVYEAKPEPSGLARNIAQCLDDFGIPLHTGMTVTRVFGNERLEAVEISAVDEKMRPIPGTESRLACDGMILSVGLIPENELALGLGVPLDPRTKGAVCDQQYMSGLPGVFCCGNALHVNDLVDYVSESGAAAGAGAAKWALDARQTANGDTRGESRPTNERASGSDGLPETAERAGAETDQAAGQSGAANTAGAAGERTASAQTARPMRKAACMPPDAGHVGAGEFSASGAARTAGPFAVVEARGNLAYVLPQRLALDRPLGKTVFFFRVRGSDAACALRVECAGQALLHKRYRAVRPPEMERLELDLSSLALAPGDQIVWTLESAGEPDQTQPATARAAEKTEKGQPAPDVPPKKGEQKQPNAQAKPGAADKGGERA